jgi:uncharacterized protein YciI
MKFANYIRYVEDQDAVAAIRPAHRAYLYGLLEVGQLAAAGPFADGSGHCSSMRPATSTRRAAWPRPIRTPSAA